MDWDTLEAREFYFVPEVAGRLRMTVKSVRNLVKARRIAFYQDRPGATVRIRHGDLMDYLASMKVEVEPERGGK